MKRKPLTEEHKKKISESLRNAVLNGASLGHPKGTPAWNKGMSLENGDVLAYAVARSEETKKRMSKAKKGIRVPEERRKRIALSLTGRKMSDECKAKISLALKGTKKVFSVEHRANISKANKGRKLTKEWIKNCMRRRIPTSLEVKFQEIVDKLQLPYRYVGNGEVIIGRKNPDFVNTNGRKIAVEVYARYYKWRHCDDIEQWKNDRRKAFETYGWEVVFLDETQVNEPEVIKQLGGK